MTLDKLNRRGGAAPAGRRTLDSTDKHKQHPLHEKLLAPPSSSSSTTSDVARSLQTAMPRLLLRFVLTTLLFAGVVAAAALYYPHNDYSARQLAATRRTNDFVPVAKTATTLSARHHQQQQQQQQLATAPSVQVLAKYPHDATAFTQGLLLAKQGSIKYLIESTGLFGASTLRQVDIATGHVVASYALPPDVFGEGVTLTPTGEFVLLTWKSQRGFVFRTAAAATATSGVSSSNGFELVREFPFTSTTGEGWGIDALSTQTTTDDAIVKDEELVVSDGSATLLFWDRATFHERRRVTVTFNGEAVPHVNELESANGFVYANIWYQHVIVKIEPATGVIVAVFDCSALVADATTDQQVQNDGAVLNGIAYDGDDDVFYLTGKRWNVVYKVKLIG